MIRQGTRNLPTVLIPDGECYITQSIVNGLAQIKGIVIYVISNEENNAVRYSRYVHKYLYYPKTKSDVGWIANIRTVVENHDIDLVMPIWDASIRILIAHRDELSFKAKLVLLPSLSDFDTARDKGLLAAHLEAKNLPGPKSVRIKSIDQLDKVNRLNFPMLIKPVEGFAGGDRIRLVNSKDDIVAFFIEKKIDYENIAQEFIDGYDFGCNVLCKDGEILAFTIQKGSVPDQKKFAPSIRWEYVNEPELYFIIEGLMKSLNWSGVANIDLLYDKNNSQFYVLEVNARFWGSTDGSTLAGVNFPYLYCLASVGIDFIKPSYRNIKYLSTKGLNKMIKMDKTFLFKLGFILNNTPLKFSLRDPLPMLYKLFSKS
jgi:predicted ATP-grasp superfamily ATP-dependent carboligase